MNILIVPPSDWVYHPLRTRLHYIFERLSKRHNVHVLEFEMNRWNTHPRATPVKLHKARSLPARDLSAYYLVNSPTHFALISKILKCNAIDVVVFANIIPGLIASATGTFHHATVVCDYLDHFPDSAAIYYDNPALRQLVRAGVDAVLRLSLGTTDHVVTISDAFVNLLKCCYCVPPERISMIPNGVDLERFRPMAREQALDRIGFTHVEKFIIVYSGSVEPWNDLETPIEAVRRLSATGLGIHMLIVGGSLSGGYYQRLLSKYSKAAFVTFTGFVSPTEVPFYLNAADCCIFPARGGTISAGVPLKLLEYFACEKLVLTTPNPAVAEEVGNISLVYENLDDLCELLTVVSGDPEKYQILRQRARMCAEGRSWDEIARKYECLLMRLCQQDGWS